MASSVTADSGCRPAIPRGAAIPRGRGSCFRGREFQHVTCWRKRPGCRRLARILSIRNGGCVRMASVSADRRIWPPPSRWERSMMFMASEIRRDLGLGNGKRSNLATSGPHKPAAFQKQSDCDRLVAASER